jgi:hypothetical protein
MKAVLVVALVASVAANVWLVSDRGAEREVVVRETTKAAVLDVAAPAPTKPRASATADGDGLDAAKKRIADLEAELAVAKDKAATLDGMDPLGVILYARRELSWKVRELLKMPEKERGAAAWKLGQALGEKPENQAEILAALRSETDADALRTLAEILRAGAGWKWTPDQRKPFMEMLKTGEPAARRAAAARAGWGGAQPAESGAALIEALRADPSPEVVGTVADMMASGSPNTDALEALRGAAERIGPGPDRRKVMIAIGRSTFMSDRGADLYRRFGEAATQEMRDDVAAALARTANGMSFSGGNESAEQREARVAAAKAKFFPVYQGTSELKVRQELVRGSMYGLNIGSFAGPQAAETSKFLRELVPLEPDAAQKERLERLAKLVESGGAKSSQDFDKVLYGRE